MVGVENMVLDRPKLKLDFCLLLLVLLMHGGALERPKPPLVDSYDYPLTQCF